jgi:pyruvate,water dikinase
MGNEEHAAPGGFVIDLGAIDRTQRAVAGGKGAYLGELARIDGVRVPPGFCVTTAAFRRAVADVPAIDERLDRLQRLAPGDRDAIGRLSAELRALVEGIAIPADMGEAITRALDRLGGATACAVRSSATAEDQPGASFAGQQDTFLDVVGPAAILAHVSRCWASLFTDRAVTYRLRNGVDQRRVEMAVVVQAMVPAESAGVLFTADPVSGDRRLALVEAVPGLGDALVSGRVDPDRFTVRDDAVVSRHRADEDRPPALTDAQAVRLVRLGRRIEAHLGGPQDIEWCLVGDDVSIVQARPITTLFPIPAADDEERHVYVSVGHQQMMTDPIRPLGVSLWQLTAARPMHEAAGRLFVDVARELASPATRDMILRALGTSDPLIGDALQTIVDREDGVPARSGEAPPPPPPPALAPSADAGDLDPAIVTELMERGQASTAALAREVESASGPALVDLVLSDIAELKRILFDPRSRQVYLGAMEASAWLNERLEAWLGETNAADTLTQSVPHNVTSEMGLALLDVADAIRPHPEVVAFLREAGDEGFLDELSRRAGGPQARAAIEAFLDRYGMRCVGEIDITRPRWSERPTALVPAILGNVDHVAPGEARRRFERGRQEALAREQELLERLRRLPDGAAKAAETKRMIDRVRTFIGYREYPKYFIVGRYFVYKRALLREADRLVRAGVLRDREDAFFLTLPELRDVARTDRVDPQLVDRRREAFASSAALTPPRVMTSDGEVVTGAYRRDDAPEGALIGLPVSAGVVEGRARVILDIADADLEPGDILVTAFTDPSWSPLFVAIAGLVTEVGGLMTHGAVIAREYGLPAVVGVQDATRAIRDGQRIRVDGTHGSVEVCG